MKPQLYVSLFFIICTWCSCTYQPQAPLYPNEKVDSVVSVSTKAMPLKNINNYSSTANLTVMDYGDINVKVLPEKENTTHADSIFNSLQRQLNLKRSRIVQAHYFGLSQDMTYFSWVYLSDCGLKIIDGAYLNNGHLAFDITKGYDLSEYPDKFYYEWPVNKDKGLRVLYKRLSKRGDITYNIKKSMRNNKWEMSISCADFARFHFERD